MSDQIDRLLPADDDPLPDASAALDALEDDLDPDAADDLTLAVEEPPPLGRAPLFDHSAGRFVTGAGHGPLETRGLGTLFGWMHKCLRTEQGASPIHPEEYGLRGTTQGIGMPFDSPELADLEDRVREALTFHPRITGVEDFKTDYDPDDEYLAASFVAVLDDDTRLPMEMRLA